MKHTTKGIASLVCLKTTLQIVPMICKALECIVSSDSDSKGDSEGDCLQEDGENNSTDRSALGKAIVGILANEELKEVQSKVEDIFTESTSYMKNTHAMRHQECFALKPSTNGMMDVLRKVRGGKFSLCRGVVF